MQGDLPMHLKGMTRSVCSVSVTVSVTSVSQREGTGEGVTYQCI